MFRVVFILLLFSSAIVSAQQTTELIEEKINIENSIKTNLENLIKTQLAAETFKVGVSVEIIQIPTPPFPIKRQPIKKRKPSSQSLPGEFYLGFIDVDEIIDSYERELAESRRVAESLSQTLNGIPNKKTYRIKSALVTVGLEKKYGEEYFANFETWLNQHVKKTLGSKASTEISEIKEIEEKPEEPRNKDDFSNRSLYEQLRDLQWLIVSFLLSGGLLASILLWKTLASKDTRLRLASEGELRTPDINQSNENKAAEPLPEIEEPTPEPQPHPPAPLVEREFTPNLREKICGLVDDPQIEIHLLAQSWINEGAEQGCLKTTLVIDVLRGPERRFENDSLKASQRASRIKILNSVLNEHVDLAKLSFETASEASPEERMALLEEAYWDLLAAQTLGPQVFEKPFSYLSTVQPEHVQNLIAGQDDAARALTLIHLPPQVQAEVLKNYDFNEKTQFFAKALQLTFMEPDSLKDFDTATRVLSESLKQKSQKKISLFPRTARALSAMSPTEELRMVRHLSQLNSQTLNLICELYPTVALLDQWTTDNRTDFIEDLSNEEISGLLRVLPDLQGIVLESCSPRQRAIVEDDLSVADLFSNTQSTQILTNLKRKLNRFLQSRSLKIENLYPDIAESQENFNAA